MLLRHSYCLLPSYCECQHNNQAGINIVSLQGVNTVAWKQHWINRRFGRLEKMLQPKQGKYSHTDSLTMADCCLVPQVGSS